MIRTSRLFAIMGVLGLALCGPSLAQDRHGDDPERVDPRGYPHDARRGDFRPPDRREPGDGAFGYPAPSHANPYVPPRYPGPPPRRPGPAGAGWRTDREDPPGLYQGRGASLEWVIETIRRRTPGRELDATVETFGGRPVYRVLWVTVHGRRVDFMVDCQTGAILSAR